MSLQLWFREIRQRVPILKCVALISFFLLLATSLFIIIVITVSLFSSLRENWPKLHNE
jgi:hypothetical protein